MNKDDRPQPNKSGFAHEIPALRPGRPRVGVPVGAPGGYFGALGRGTNTIKTAGLIYMNPVSAPLTLGQPWDITDIATSPTLKGYGWEKFQLALLAMGYPPAAWIDTTVNGNPAFQVGGPPYGEAACALASLFDLTFLGHGSADNVNAKIRQLAAKYGRSIRIGNWLVNYESINQAIQLSGFDEALRQVVKNSYLRDGTGPNGYGCIKIDQFETDPSPACPPADAPSGSGHTWYANTADLSGAESTALLAALTSALATHFSSNRPTEIMVDNALDQENYGVATNAPAPAPATYQAYYKIFMAALDALAPGIKKWANRGEAGVAVYSAAQIPNRYGEHYLHLNGDSLQNSAKLFTTIQSELLAAKASGITMILDHERRTGVAEIDQWSTAQFGPGGAAGTFAELLPFIVNNGLRDLVFFSALRTNKKFFATWHPEFGQILPGIAI